MTNPIVQSLANAQSLSWQIPSASWCRRRGLLKRAQIEGVLSVSIILLATTRCLLSSPVTTYETGGGASAIYVDSFSGSALASLNGKTTTVGGGIWGNYEYPNLRADGEFSGTFQNTLPVTITSGNIYELNAHITVGGADGWGGITFSGNANPIWSAFSAPYFGTLLTVGEIWPKNSANLGNLGTGDYTIRLDTTRPDWSVSYYFNGELRDSYSWVNGNPSITHAGLIGYDGSNGGKFDQFSFTKTDPAALYAVSQSDAADVNSGAAAVWAIQSGACLFGSSLAKVNDGKFIADPANRNNSADCFVPTDGTVVSVTFPNGEDILSIATYAASGSGQTRSGQDYTLEYAKRTPVIYSDTFSGSSSTSLGGRTPTTGGGFWDGGSEDGIKADGSFSGTGQKWLNWTPSNGYVYELKVTINQTSGNWAGLCFKPTAGNPIWAGFGPSGVGTMLDVNESWPKVGGIGDNGSGTYMIRLDTTAVNWTTSYFFNGVQKGATHTWTTNPAIDGVGILTYGTTTGSFENFELKTTSSQFLPLVASLNALDPQNIDAPSTSTKVNHTFTPGVLRDVGTLRFTFHNVGATDGETMYREIDVTTLADGGPFRFQGASLEPGVASELNSWIQSLNLSEVSYQNFQRSGNWDYSILPKQQDETLGVQVTGDDSQQGFILYSRPVHELIYPYSRPKSRVTELQVSAALGEYRPLSLGIWNMNGASTFQVSATPFTNTASGEQIPQENIEFRSTTMLPQLQSEQGVYFRFPAALERKTQTTIPSGESGQFWLTTHVPATTTPGTYTSAVTVLASGGGSASLPVTLTVLPYQLDEAAADLSMCFLMEDYQEMYPENLDLYMGDMKTHGLNSLWSWPMGEVTPTPAGLQADFTKVCPQAPGAQKFAHSFQETMEAYQRAGFEKPWIYGSLDSLMLILYHAGRVDLNDPNSAFSYLVDYTSQLRAFSQQNQYPEFDLLLIDEPGLYPERLASTVQLHGNMHAAFPQQRMILDCAPTSDEDIQLASSLDRILYADPNPTRKAFCEQNQLDFGNYNSGSGGKNPLIDRFCHGFWPVKAGLTAVSNWVYAWRYSPQLPGNRYVFPSSDGPVPTPAWEGVRVGIYDQRYLLTFQRLANQLSQSTSPDVRASVADLQAQVNQLLEPIPVDRSDRNGFLETYPQSGLDDIRQVLSTGIVQLLQLATPFERWQLAEFTAEQLAQPGVGGELDDPDRDGIPNLVEYALGLNPNQSSSSGLPVADVSGGYLIFSFNREKDATDITYRVEGTGDLSSSWAEIWNSTGVPYGGGGNASELVTVQDTVPVSTAPRRFMRLKLTKP